MLVISKNVHNHIFDNNSVGGLHSTFRKGKNLPKKEKFEKSATKSDHNHDKNALMNGRISIIDLIQLI